MNFEKLKNENQSEKDLDINSFHKKEVDRTIDLNDREEGELTSLQDADIKINDLEKEINNYSSIPYSFLMKKKKELEKKLGDKYNTPLEIIELNNELGDVHDAINTIENLIKRKEKSQKKLEDGNKFLVDNN